MNDDAHVNRDPITRWEVFGRRGFVVSVCCGPCGDKGFLWSVDVMTPGGMSFDVPYAANSLDHALDIVEAELKRRGWEPVS